jgi:SAM-dependent methyltransferase
MAEPADVQAHWTRPGVLARIDAALTELGHDPQNLNPEILATLDHLHSGGFATTRDQAKRVSITDESRLLDVGCGIGGPARYLAHTYGCRVDGIDLTTELVETGRVLTERCKLADRVVLQVGNALELPYPDQTFDVVWCQNVTMNIAGGERTAHALRTSPKIVDHHMPTHDIRRADVEHRWTRARSSSSNAGHDYRLHHSGDGIECVRSFDASWPWLKAGRSPRTARRKLELAVLHLLRAPQGSPRQRPMPQEPAPPASCAPAGPRQGVSDPSPDAPARSAWETA